MYLLCLESKTKAYKPWLDLHRVKGWMVVPLKTYIQLPPGNLYFLTRLVCSAVNVSMPFPSPLLNNGEVFITLWDGCCLVLCTVCCREGPWDTELCEEEGEDQRRWIEYDIWVINVYNRAALKIKAFSWKWFNKMCIYNICPGCIIWYNVFWTEWQVNALN